MPTTASLYIGATQIVTQASVPANQIDNYTTAGASTATPPAGYRFALLEAIGGGGGGWSDSPASCGDGGDYASAFLGAATIGTSPFTVTVGAGSAQGSTDPGGDTSIGSFVTAHGGQPGFNNKIKMIKTNSGSSMPVFRSEGGSGEGKDSAGTRVSATGSDLGAGGGGGGLAAAGAGGGKASALGLLQAGNGGGNTSNGNAPGGGGGGNGGNGATGAARITWIF